MTATRPNTFASGLLGGAASAALGGLALLYLAGRTDYVSLAGGVPAWFAWIDHNLGLSVPVFLVLIVLFQLTLGELAARIRRGESPDRIAQVDHLTDTWISMFFGTGVIWTAIGMRNALLFALGDPVTTVDEGAMMLLQRMVDGGILVALSTTIFGGAGGYLMRVLKTISVGADLRRAYTEHGRADALAIRESLEQMNQHLQQSNGVEQE
ncbi:MAG: hypothetical protein HKN49_13055 [Gammaproteobacteria bacterium]|nr:hypothetical protein [Gammaproteobacteria bacterium]